MTKVKRLVKRAICLLSRLKAKRERLVRKTNLIRIKVQKIRQQIIVLEKGEKENGK